MPAEFGRWSRTWTKHHPGWDLRLWTEENLPKGLRRPEAYERIRMPAERSDILRLDLLHRFGGIYIDTDFECRDSLEPLIAGLDFFAAYAKPARVNNAIIGSVPGHPILARALETVRPREFFGHDKRGTGPLFFGALLADYPDVKIFEPGLFYPSQIEEEQRAVAIHHRARSWMGDVDLRRVVNRLERRLMDAQARTKDAEARLRKLDRREAARLRKLEKKAGGRAGSLVRRTLARVRDEAGRPT